MGARFLYPARGGEHLWVFVSDVAGFPSGSARTFRTPEGAPVAVARRGETGTVEDFVALSSTCPHLGCQVYWQNDKSRFFCPCHNGTFDAEGAATGGPPKEANQFLARYPLEIRDGLLFIEVPTPQLTGDGRIDACLPDPERGV